MEEVKYVSSISEFLSWVEETRPRGADSEHALFYRGHSDKSYRLEPTVYRVDGEGKSFRQVEHQLYEEMLRHSPTAFSEDKGVFERLVRMQHHGLPTRLLDLTHSPLIALYFACSGNASKPKVAPKEKKEGARDNDEKAGKDGEVIFFPRKRADVLHPSDIPEAALVGVDQSVDFSHIAAQVTTKLASYLSESRSWLQGHIDLTQDFTSLIGVCSEALEAIKGITDLFETATILLGIETAVRAFGERWDKVLEEKAAKADSAEVALSISNAHVALLKYLNRFEDHIVGLIVAICEGLRLERNVERRSLSGFFNQFTRFHFVYPPINSERIRRQQGAFLICPPGKTMRWQIGNIQTVVHRVRIGADAKTQILKELSYLGITHSYVYPDLTAVATDAKACYPATTEAPIKGFDSQMALAKTVMHEDHEILQALARSESTDLGENSGQPRSGEGNS